jgi:aconitate hydratase
MPFDPIGAKKTIPSQYGDITIWSLPSLQQAGIAQVDRLPYSIRVLLESVLRQSNQREILPEDAITLAGWKALDHERSNVPFLPARVIMQDFTGVPAVVDLAAMRSAVTRAGGNPEAINPVIPVDLVIDHSVQVDFFASPEAFRRNAEIEFQRNQERYEFLRWGQEAFKNFRVVPPATGIVHQVNLEYLAKVVLTREVNGTLQAYPDTLVGTDSHTTMINGLGVLGWGVGGIEAEAAMLGLPLVMLAPDVIGFCISGRLAEGVTATDLVLTVTEILREHGVVGKFVEFYGPGLASLSLPDRATISNMAPEYGATAGYFPVDDETLHYLRLSGRSEAETGLVEWYCKEQGLFRAEDSFQPEYTEIIELDLARVQPSLAGPRRPQDRLSLSESKKAFSTSLSRPRSEGGFGKTGDAVHARATLRTNGSSLEVGHGVVVIAAITSCTNTSNPNVMVTAGLLARNAVQRGLRVRPYVKTSLAPGSTVVTEYLSRAGLLDPLATLGFNLVGYGCTTCIGNSGPLPGEVVKAITESDLISAAVLSGNRNFEGRINPHVRANYLASPPLVVVYALAGTTDIDLTSEPIGVDQEGKPVFLRDLWPSSEEVNQILDRALTPEMFRSKYSDVFRGNASWNEIPISGGALYQWNPDSTYIQEPPFFLDLSPDIAPLEDIRGARVLALLGDSVTTDHISPAGAIPVDSPAGKYLEGQGVQPRDFNSFGSRRGNDRIMTRGTFGNIRLKNRLVPGIEGGFTAHLPDGAHMSIYEAALKYRQESVPLVILAGREYGTGSSRDWAAKGTLLLGVRAVIAQSFERIHRSNLIGMGVLPLEFASGESVEALGLSGHEQYDILGLDQALQPGAQLDVTAAKEDGDTVRFKVKVRIDTPSEVDIYRNGGILHMVLRRMLASSATG